MALFTNRFVRMSGHRRVTLAGFSAFSAAALVLLTGISAGAQSKPALDPVTAKIMQRLGALSADSMEGRRAGSPGAARARNWIIGELKSAGVKPIGSTYEMPFALRQRGGGGSGGGSDTLGVNVVAMIPGKSSGGPVIVLSAHYDHLGVRNGEIYNGADDDASGCVALLTIAERLMKDAPTHDIILAFFDGEEGGMQGSRAFVASPPVPLERIALNINLDMVARQDGGALWVSGTSYSPFLKPLAEAVARTAAISIRFGHDTKDLKPGDDWTNSSDHAPFHAKGIPFFYLGVEDHPDYHKPGDDVDKIDPVFYRGSVEFASALLLRADRSLKEIQASTRSTRE